MLWFRFWLCSILQVEGLLHSERTTPASSRRGLEPERFTNSDSRFRRAPRTKQVAVDDVALGRWVELVNGVLVVCHISQLSGKSARLRDLRRNDVETKLIRSRQRPLHNLTDECIRERRRRLNDTAFARIQRERSVTPSSEQIAGVRERGSCPLVDSGAIRRGRHQRIKRVVRRVQGICNEGEQPRSSRRADDRDIHVSNNV